MCLFGCFLVGEFMFDRRFDEHCCRVIRFLAEEGLIMSEFHAPRRLSKLSPAERKMAEHILEAKKIAANLKPSLIRK